MAFPVLTVDQSQPSYSQAHTRHEEQHLQAPGGGAGPVARLPLQEDYEDRCYLRPRLQYPARDSLHPRRADGEREQVRENSGYPGGL